MDDHNIIYDADLDCMQDKITELQLVLEDILYKANGLMIGHKHRNGIDGNTTFFLGRDIQRLLELGYTHHLAKLQKTNTNPTHTLFGLKITDAADGVIGIGQHIKCVNCKPTNSRM